MKKLLNHSQTLKLVYLNFSLFLLKPLTKIKLRSLRFPYGLRLSIYGLCFLLLGCNAKISTQNGLLEHPEKLKIALEDCQKIDGEGNTAYCRMVFQTADIMRTNLLLAIQNREAFGEKIIQLQMTIADIQKQMAQLPNTPEAGTKRLALKQQLVEQTSVVKQYLNILRIMGL